MSKVNVGGLFQTLLDKMGPQGWWPAESKPEIILGAILVQKTDWRNTEKALSQLNARTGFLPEKSKNCHQKS